MSHRLWGAALALAMIVAGPATRADAQGLTGQISGVVTDSGGGVMPGATVTVKNVGTNLTREAVTGADGVYTITNLLAGTFDLTVTVQGFKPYEQKGIVLGATERLALRAIALEIGGLSEVVSVAAESVKVQTTSGERSATITAGQIEDIGLRGRDFMGSLKMLPGVIDTSARDAPGWGSVGGMTINGQNSFNFSYDGVTNKDTGSNSGNYAAPALDSIAEVKVQASNFQAEYGRSSGATITVVTKSGTRDFHGTAAYYKRNEKFNTNSWDRRRQCDAGQLASCAKAPYRFDNTAWTIGGPVLVPGTDFNKNRDKLFFFFSQDLLPRNDPGTLQLSTMPTALERAGDFSQTFDSQGRTVCIKDPQLAAQGLACNVNSGGPGCFPGNRIPANRISPIGQQMLGLFPLPNATDPSGNRQYNYTYQNELEKPRNDQVARVDYNITREHDVLHARAVRQRGQLARRERVPRRRHGQRRQRRLAAVQYLVRGRIGQPGEHAAAHLQRIDGGRSDGRPQLGGAARQQRRRRRRSIRTIAASSSAGCRSSSRAPTRSSWCRRSATAAPTPCRTPAASALPTAIRSTPATRSGTTRRTCRRSPASTT